jgi:hypothetical protein
MSHRAFVLLFAFLFLAGCAGTSSKTNPTEPAAPDRRGELRLRLAAQREVQIERLRSYRQAGVFPRQRVEPSRLVNVLVDDEGHLCAVASLMEHEGLGHLVRLTAVHSNQLQMADVKDGPFLEWILGSGLTQEEIVRVQMPYAYDARTPVAREAERVRLVAHFERVEAELLRDAEASLDLAVARVMAREERAARSQALRLASR